MLYASPATRFGGVDLSLIFSSFVSTPQLFPIFLCSPVFSFAFHIHPSILLSRFVVLQLFVPPRRRTFILHFLPEIMMSSRHPETPKINRSGGCDSFSVEGAIFTPSQHAMISLEIAIHRTLHIRPSSVLRCDHPVFADGQTRPPEPLTQSANMAGLLFGTQLKLARQTLHFLHHHFTSPPTSSKAHQQWHAHSLLSSSFFSPFSLWPTPPP